MNNLKRNALAESDKHAPEREKSITSFVSLLGLSVGALPMAVAFGDHAQVNNYQPLAYIPTAIVLLIMLIIAWTT